MYIYMYNTVCDKKDHREKANVVLWGCIRQDKVEEIYSKPFRRPQMMGKA